MATVYVSPEGRASFCDLVEPNRDDKYQVTLLLESDTDIDELWDAIDEALFEKFGNDAPDPKDISVPISYAGDINKVRERKGKKIWDGYEDGETIVLKCSTRDAPGLVNEDNEIVTKPNKRDWYSGMKCKVVFVASYYDKGGNEGIGFWIQAVQRTGEGDRFVGEKIDPTKYLDPVKKKRRGRDESEDRPRGRRGRDESDDEPRTKANRRRDDEDEDDRGRRGGRERGRSRR